MSPRRGGEADKIGNRYETAWVIMHLLFVLQGRGQSVRIEDIGELGEGSEFTYKDASATHVHQLKRQNGLVNNWTVTSLRSLGIWAHAKSHVMAGRQYHFASTVPARDIQELIMKSQQAQDLNEYIKTWLPENKKLIPVFDELAASGTLGSPQEAFHTLQGMHLNVYGENEINSVNEVIAETILEGGNGKTIVASLANLVVNNLTHTLSRDVILSKLSDYDIQPVTGASFSGLATQISETSKSWLDSVERQLIRPFLERSEADHMFSLLTEGNDKFILLTGAAGGGKSAVLHQVVSALQGNGVPTLCFRLDRLEPFSSTAELGSRLGLNKSPVAALAVLANGAPSVLVVDQIDAVSFASGRMPNSLDPVADLVREAEAFPQMRVVWACRQFDVDNDERIRSLVKQREAETLSVGLLTEAQVIGAVGVMGLNSDLLTVKQREMLRTPFNLSLLEAIADDVDLTVVDRADGLLKLFWERKRRDAQLRRSGVRFDKVVRLIAETMSTRQTLSIPDFILDDDDLIEHANVLVSENLLTRQGSRVAFAHEALFDYAFARAWMARDTSLVAVFEQDAQELFRRGQLRQIMTLMRSAEPERFAKELEQFLVSSQIRFHLKDVAIAVIATFGDPTAKEAEAVVRVAESSDFADRIWRRLNTSAWFDRLDKQTYIEKWLKSNRETRAVAIELIARAAADLPTRVAKLAETDSVDPEALRYILRFARFAGRDAMFDLAIIALQRGVFVGHEQEFWRDVHDLPEVAPKLAMEILQSYLEEQQSSFAVDKDGKIALLSLSDYSASEFIENCAKVDPVQFCRVVVPYLIRVMKLTPSIYQDDYGYQRDNHFNGRERDTGQGGELGDVLIHATADALASLPGTDIGSLVNFLDLLADAEMDSAQYLIYVGLIASGEALADRSAQYMLGGTERLFSSWQGNSVWMARRLLLAVNGYVSDEQHSRLEDMVRDLQFTWETQGRRWYAFTLLSALDESRLSDLGRRRLGEYRRRLDCDTPPEPVLVTGGFIGPPIPSASASKMKDRNWLSAIRKHSADRSNWTTFTGGARELASVLREQTKEDAARFSSLALSFDEQVHSAYGDAILMGLGDASPLTDPAPIYRAIKHIASFGHEENDRWIGWALRPYYAVAPLDMVELVRDRGLTAQDPTTDNLRFSRERDTLGRNSNLEMTAMNCVRGSLVEALGDLLVFDTDGSRTAAVVPVLARFAEDPVVAVRVSSAHLLAATLRYNRPAVLAALPRLLDTHDVIFAASTTSKLLNYIGNRDPDLVEPLINRMLSSDELSVRRVGGHLAAFSALEWNRPAQLERVLEENDSAARRGAAELCAEQLRRTGNTATASRVIEALAKDVDDEVRKAAASVAAALRGVPLRQFAGTLTALLQSPSFAMAMPQILYTLEHAPDRVDDLVVLCAGRFVAVHGADSADIRTGAAGDASHVGKLVIRALAQADTPDVRAELLDVVDGLLRVGSYGIEDLVAQSERL